MSLRHMFEVLGRIQQDHGQTGEALGDLGTRALLLDDLEERADSALRAIMAIAERSTHIALGRALAERLRKAPSTPALQRFAANCLIDISRRSVALFEVRLWAIEFLVENPLDWPILSKRCYMLLDLGGALIDLRRPQSARTALQEALTEFSSLFEEEPQEHLEGFVLTGLRLALALIDSGAPSSAIEHLRAASLLLTLWAPPPMDERFAQLQSEILLHLGIALAQVGQNEDALEQTRRAQAILNAQAQHRDGMLSARAARMYGTLANRYGALKAYPEGAEAAGRAAEAFAILADHDPDTYASDHAVALINYANRLGDVGRHGEALEQVEHGLSKWRSLASVRPDSFGLGLAMALGSLAMAAAEVGEETRALEAIVEGSRRLWPYFEASPKAHAQQMRTMLGYYLHFIGDAPVDDDMHTRLRNCQRIFAAHRL